MEIQNLELDLKLVEIYTTSSESFSVGTIIYQDDNDILFKIYDEQGQAASFYVVKRSYITSMKYDTEYLQKMALYLEFWKSHGVSDVLIKKPPFVLGKPMIPQIIEYAKNNKEIVTLATSTSSNLETGYVRTFENDIVNLECIDMETAKGFDWLELNVQDICFLEIESTDNKLLAYANQHID